MNSINHPPSCMCSSCRSRRPSAPPPSTRPTIEKTINPAGSSSAAPLIPLIVRVTGKEQDIIDLDPAVFITVMKERDFSDQEIRNKLTVALPEMSRNELDELFAQANVSYKEDSKGRSARRIWSGTVMLAGGLIITVPLALFGSFFTLFGIILILAGVFQLGKGIHEAKG